MPVMGGYCAIMSLRKQGYRGLFVALSASATLMGRKKAIASGCDYFIAKPIERDFEERIKAILAESEKNV